MAKILISGGTGSIGKVLVNELKKKGHEIRILARRPDTSQSSHWFLWDPSNGIIDPRAFEDVDHMVHLAGSNIAEKAWTQERKLEIINSRIKSSELIFNTLRKYGFKLKSFTGASATGYYGIGNKSKLCTEESPAGTDFLANICVVWEQSYEAFQSLGIRTNVLRIGIVLGKNMGIYGKLFPFFSRGMGVRFGNINEYISWIHISDLARMFTYCIEQNNMNGTFNAVASNPVNTINFCESLAKSTKSTIILPAVPEFVFRLLLGERSCLITKGVCVSNEKIRSSGFKFEYNEIKTALENLYNQ